MKKAMLLALIGLFLVLGYGPGYAADAGTKEEAVAMVKKAIEYIKANGNEKAFEEISNPKGKFIDRDLYVVVYDMNAKCLAHGQKKNMVGKELIDFKDTDGKEYMKERIGPDEEADNRLAGLQIHEPRFQTDRAQIHVPGKVWRSDRRLRNLQQIIRRSSSRRPSEGRPDSEILRIEVMKSEIELQNLCRFRHGAGRGLDTDRDFPVHHERRGRGSPSFIKSVYAPDPHRQRCGALCPEAVSEMQGYHFSYEDSYLAIPATTDLAKKNLQEAEELTTKYPELKMLKENAANAALKIQEYESLINETEKLAKEIHGFRKNWMPRLKISLRPAWNSWMTKPKS